MRYKEIHDKLAREQWIQQAIMLSLLLILEGHTAVNFESRKSRVANPI